MLIRHLFTPMKIGKVEVKNRIVMLPINNSTQTHQAEGTITRRCVDYYVERAKGGAGLLITGVFKVENEIEKCQDLKTGVIKWPLLTIKSVQQYADLANQVHSYGAKIFMQLSAGPGRVTFPDVIESGVVPVSASANRCHFMPSVTCRPLKTREVESIVQAFADAAEIAATAGADGVEVHGHEGYLIDQFTTALWNRRTDKYGGCLRARLTFPIEILNAIKGRLGNDFPVIYRFGVRHFIKEGIRPPWKSALRETDNEDGRGFEEAIEIAKYMEEVGYDALSVDTGCYESTDWAHPPYYFPRGFAMDMTSRIKKAVEIPVLVAGRLGVPELCEKGLEEGKADLIGLARDLLADPYWPMKVQQGREDDIRPCLGCQDGCMHRPNTTGAFMSCSVNPSCGREQVAPLLPALKKKRVMVIGGGLAGMECARIADLRGHTVTLFERTSELGGHLIEAMVPDFKDDLKKLLSWYKKQLSEGGVDVKLNTEVTEALVKGHAPDTIIVATGSAPERPAIPGIDRDKVATCCEVLVGAKKVGSNPVVVGGGLEGCETALWLAKQGKQVTIVEMQSDIANSGIFSSNRVTLVNLIQDHGIKVLTDSRLFEVTDEGITVLTKDMQMNFVECDTVLLAVGMKPNQDLYRALSTKSNEVYMIGDCQSPRRIHDAVWEGWNVGRTI